MLQPFHTLPIPSFHAEWLAFFLGIFSVFSFLIVTKQKHVLQIPLIVIAPLGLAGVVSIQLALGMFAYAANASTMATYLIWATGLAILGRCLAERIGLQRCCTYLAWFVFVGGIINAGFGLMQYAEISDYFFFVTGAPTPIKTSGIYGNLAQQNHFSTHLGMALVSGCYLGFSKKLKTIWLFLFVAVLVTALLLSGSRSGLLFLGLTVVLLIAVTCRNQSNPLIKKIVWIAIAFLLLLVFALWLSAQYFPMNAQFQRLVTLHGAIVPRLYLWKNALHMFAEHPILGVGFDAFAYQLIEQLHLVGDPSIWGIDQYPHNLILQLLAVSGVLGFAAVVLPMFFFFRQRISMPLTLEGMWFFGMIGILLIHSMLEQPLFYAYFLGIAAVIMGVADSTYWTVTLSSKWKIALLIFCVLGLAWLAKIAKEFDQIEGHFYSSRYVLTDPTSKAQARESVIKGVGFFSPIYPITELVAPEFFIANDAPINEKIAFNQRVMHFAPIPETVFRHAALLAEANQKSAAEKQFAMAAYAYPLEAPEYLSRIQHIAEHAPSNYVAFAQFATQLLQQKRSKAP